MFVMFNLLLKAKSALKHPIDPWSLDYGIWKSHQHNRAQSSCWDPKTCTDLSL